LDITTIGAHHSVTSVTGKIMPCCWCWSQWPWFLDLVCCYASFVQDKDSWLAVCPILCQLSMIWIHLKHLGVCADCHYIVFLLIFIEFLLSSYLYCSVSFRLLPPITNTINDGNNFKGNEIMKRFLPLW